MSTPNQRGPSPKKDTVASEPRPAEAQPLISVVVPSHNRFDILRECLKALAQQTYSDYELIVVDDASTDETPSLLAEFASEHPDLRFWWLVNEENLGANASRNRGIREAHGQLVAFLDSDCIAEPDWLEKLASGFDSDAVASVTGTVINPSPTNVYELVVKGTSRVHGRGAAPRLVGGNMCIRRELLLKHPLDEDLKYGCDEEGIYLRLRAAGFLQNLVPEAVVRHEHYYTRRSFFRQAWVGGAAAAWLVYKYHLPQRIDLLPFVFGYLTLPLGLVSWWLLAIPGVFALITLGALLYNETSRKKKTVSEVVRLFPFLLAYYHVRLAGYAIQAVRLRLCPNSIMRVRL